MDRDPPRLPDKTTTIKARVPEGATGQAAGQRGLVATFIPGVVIGDFELIRELGRGGTGMVWEAEQISMRRHVALKLLFPHFVRSERTLQRFRREAEAGGKLAHPGIVQVYAIGTADGVHYMAMEMVPGGDTLADALADLRDQNTLPNGYYRTLAELIGRVADALQVAHDAGIVHRDVKPSNILIADDDQPKVADFGLAKVSSDMALSQTGELAGTPFYMSPEQAAGKRIGIDHRTDIFSLGATLYEALTLRRPFDGDTSQQVLAQILLADPPDPQELRSKVPRDLRVICLKALEKRPDHRFATMADFAADLRRYLADEPIEARPPRPLVRAGKWARRHRVASVGGGITMVALMIVSTLLFQVDTARAKAAHEASVSERSLNFMVEFFEISDPNAMQGRDITAKAVLDNGVERVRVELADQPLVQARMLQTMGRVYHSLGEYAAAEPLLVQALSVHRHVADQDVQLLLTTLNDLAVLFADQARYEEARPLLIEAIAACREHDDEDPQLFEYMSNLADLYARDDRAADARKLHLDVLDGRRRILGEDHHDTLRSLHRVGAMFRQEGRLDLAETLIVAAMDGQRDLLGRDHPHTLSSMASLALVYDGRGWTDKAEKAFAESLAGRRRTLGDEHPVTLRSVQRLADFYLGLRRLGDAEPLVLEAVAGRRAALGPSHPDTLSSTEEAATLLASMGRFDEARLLARDLMDHTVRNDPRFAQRRELMDRIVERRLPSDP